MPSSETINLSHIADFLQSPVAIDVAGSNPSHRPSLARGLGCRVLNEGRQCCIFLSRPRSQALLDDLRIHPQLAAVFCLPTTEQALQIKGVVSDIRLLTAEEQLHLEACCQSFAAEIAQIGYSTEFAAHYRYAGECVALIVTPTDIYEQTPGPLAGSRLTRPQP